MFRLLFGPVNPHHPAAYPAWRRLLTPLMFFRSVPREGLPAWEHNKACRPLLEAAWLSRISLAIVLFHIAALIAPHSALASLPLWLIMLVFGVQAIVYAVVWVFLGYQDVELLGRRR